VERSDTHHVQDNGDGFREGLNPSYDLLPDGLFDLPDGLFCTVMQFLLSSPLRKNILLRRRPKSAIHPLLSRSPEGRIAIVTDAERDAVDAGGASDEGAHLADGEVVWS
jgi:hypothetical protein